MKARFCTFIMICLAAIAICLPNSVLKAEAAKSGKCGDNVTYTLGDDGTMTLSGRIMLVPRTFHGMAIEKPSRRSLLKMELPGLTNIRFIVVVT